MPQTPSMYVSAPTPISQCHLPYPKRREKAFYKTQTHVNERKCPLCICVGDDPDSKVYGANMRPTWVLSAPGWSHVGPINLAIRGVTFCSCMCYQWNWPESTLSNDVPCIRRICDLNNVSLFIFLLEDTQTLSRLHKYLYETFRTRASISTGVWSK